MMIRYCFVAVLVFGLSLASAQTGNPPPATPVAKPPGTHTLNLKDADIQVLIATVSEITGKNFIIGPNVQGKVTVVSATPMKPDEIYDTFLSVLRVNGYAAIQSGSMVKIVAEATAQQDGSGGLDVGRKHETDELVTQIIPLKHVSATELVPILSRPTSGIPSRRAISRSSSTSSGDFANRRYSSWFCLTVPRPLRCLSSAKRRSHEPSVLSNTVALLARFTSSVW